MEEVPASPRNVTPKTPKQRLNRIVFDDQSWENTPEQSETQSDDYSDEVTECATEACNIDYDPDDEEEIMNAIPSGKMEKMRDKRNNIATEVLTTERTYVSNLDIIVQVYMEPMNAAVDEGILTKDEMKVIFGNARIIRGYNQLLLQDLEQRLTDWSDTQMLADVFLKMAVFFKTYTQYINDFDASRAMLKKMLEENDKFRALIERLDSDPRTGRQILKDFLIMPVQRIPRYTMLLRDLWSATWPAHPDYNNLMQAYAQMEKIAQFVEGSKEKLHNISHIAKIQSQLLGKNVESLHLVNPGRKLIMEGPLEELIKNDQLKKRHVYLFNDFILVTKPRKGNKKELRHASPLYKVSTIKQVTRETTRGLSFIISNSEVQLYPGDSEKDINGWFKALIENFAESMETRQKFLAVGGESPEKISPRGRSKSLKTQKKAKRLSTRAAQTMPVENVTKTTNPLYRHASSAAPKRSTITYGDVVQSEMMAAGRSAKKGRMSSLAATDSAIPKSPSMHSISGSLSDDEDEDNRKGRSLTFTEPAAKEASSPSAGRSPKPSFLRSISVENLKHTLIQKKSPSVAKEV